MAYEVTVQRDARLWFIRVPAINRSTQARNEAEIPVMARDLIEIVTGEKDAAINVRFVVADE